MSIKSKSIKSAFQKGKRTGIWIAMNLIKKETPKPKLEISDVKDIKNKKEKPKKKILEIEDQKDISIKSKKPKKKPKLEFEDQKDISIKSKKPKLEISDVKDIKIKKEKKKKPKLEFEDQKDISIKSKKPKKKLEFEDQKGISKKGMSEEVKEFLKSDVPTKKILSIQELPSINLESKILDKFDKNIQTEHKNKIKLIVEDNINQQIIDEPFIQIREIIKEDEDNYEEFTYSYDEINDISGPGITPFIFEPVEDDEDESSEQRPTFLTEIPTDDEQEEEQRPTFLTEIPTDDEA